MLYIFEEKDLDAVMGSSLLSQDADKTVIVVKDENKPVFSAAQVNKLFELKDRIAGVEIADAANKEQVMFLIGGMMATEDVTLVNCSLEMPSYAKGRVKFASTEKPEKKPRPKAVKKPEPAAENGMPKTPANAQPAANAKPDAPAEKADDEKEQHT